MYRITYVHSLTRSIMPTTNAQFRYALTCRNVTTNPFNS